MAREAAQQGDGRRWSCATPDVGAHDRRQGWDHGRAAARKSAGSRETARPGSTALARCPTLKRKNSETAGEGASLRRNFCRAQAIRRLSPGSRSRRCGLEDPLGSASDRRHAPAAHRRNEPSLRELRTCPSPNGFSAGSSPMSWPFSLSRTQREIPGREPRRRETGSSTFSRTGIASG